MKKRVTTGLLVFALVMSLLLATSASGGSSSDPVVSKSYVDNTLFNSVMSTVGAKISSRLSSLKTEYSAKLQSLIEDAYMNTLYVEESASEVLDKLQSKGEYIYSSAYKTPITLSSGEVIAGDMGTMFLLTDGSAKCSDGSLINITNGTENKEGSLLGQFTTFMFPETGGKVEILSNTATVLVDGKYSVSGGYNIKYMKEAYALKELGLVRGATHGMELDRGSNRAECITMLIRLLGEESSALAADHYHTFTDVDEWVKRYVGFAYQKGYTKGVSSTKFGGKQLTTAAQYLTFVLRSLGYSEESGDFKYETALADSVRLGVIPQALANELKNTEFKRDHMMRISYVALSAKLKGSETTLLAKLVLNGVVDSASADKFLKK